MASKKAEKYPGPFLIKKQVVLYLGRYTHRIAISNDRIMDVNESSVTFTWKDYKQDYKKQVTTLKGEGFLNLFCQHILQPGFTRIRHYGFLSKAAKSKGLAIIRKTLGKSNPGIHPKMPWQEIAFKRMGFNPGICKCCNGKMVVVQIIPNKFRKGQSAPPFQNGCADKLVPSFSAS